MKTISQKCFVDFMSDVLPEMISSIMRDDTDAVAKGQLSLPQFWALHHISQQKGLTVNELAAALKRSKSTTSALLQRLEKSGFIKRLRNDPDRRVVRVTLTKKGERTIKALIESRKQGIRNTYATLSGTERAQHMRMIEKIIAGARKASSVLLLAVWVPAAGGQTNTYSLRDAIHIGLDRSLVVANAGRERQIAKATQQRAASDAYPQITGLASYTRNYPENIGGIENISGSENRAVGAEASWQIFAGGRTLSAIRAAKAYGQLTAHQERRVLETQTRDISYSYFTVQLTQAETEVRALSVKLLGDFEADARKKYDAGTASEFDWLSAKVALANERPKLISAQNRLSLAKERFKNLTYIDEGDFKLTDPLEFVPIKINLDEAISTGLQKRPELLEKTSALALRKEDINQQKSQYYPKVDLFAAYTYQNPDPYSFITRENGWQDYWNTGVRAKWTLFDGGARRADLSESKLKSAIAEDEYRDLLRSVSLDIRTQWLRGRDAIDVIEATAESVDLAERAMEIARQRFDAGLGTNLEVTQANLELSDARLTRNVALYEYMVAVTGIKYAVGNLLEEYEND